MQTLYRPVKSESIPPGHLLFGVSVQTAWMDLSPRKLRRRANVEVLIAERFNGSHADFSRATDVAESLVSRYVAGSKGIGEDMAERIEAALGLPEGWMDAAAQRGMPSIGRTRSRPAWPFKFDRARFDRLSKSGKERVEGATLMMIMECEREASNHMKSSNGS